MHITEDSSSCSMEFCEEDIKIEEVSIEDEGDYYSDATSCEDQFPPQKSENMIFTQIYIPKEGAMQGYLASPSLSEMNFKNRPGRKQKLEHLSFEEKLQRKKLKNREAAQTSRDRKKARMTELELQVRYLQQQNERLRCEKDSACKENERLKRELSHPAPGHAPPRSATPTSSTRCAGAAAHASARPDLGNGRRVDPRIAQESAAFLEVSPQKTAGEMQRSTRVRSPTPPPVSSPACAANSLREEVLSMVSTVATLLLVVAMTTSGPASPKTGTGSLILKRDHLQSAFSKLSSSQQVYLSQLLLIIAKELHQVPAWWGARQSSWNPVNFLHSNVPLFLQHLPPLPPPAPHPSSPPVASLPSLSTLVEASMKTVPAALP